MSGSLACLIFKLLGLLFTLLLDFGQVLVVFIGQPLHLPFINLRLLPLGQTVHQTLLVVPWSFLRTCGGSTQVGHSSEGRPLEVIDRGWLKFAFHHLLAELEKLLFGFGLLGFSEFSCRRTQLLVVLVCGAGIVLIVLIFTLPCVQLSRHQLFNYVFLLLLEHLSQRGLPLILLSLLLGPSLEYLNPQVLVVSGILDLCRHPLSLLVILLICLLLLLGDRFQFDRKGRGLILFLGSSNPIFDGDARGI